MTWIGGCHTHGFCWGRERGDLENHKQTVLTRARLELPENNEQVDLNLATFPLVPRVVAGPVVQLKPQVEMGEASLMEFLDFPCQLATL